MEMEYDLLLEGMDYNKALKLDVGVLQSLKEYMEGQENIDRGKYAAVCNALTELQSKHQHESQAQERKAAQEEMKETFTLPHDYNQVFGDHRANEEIRRLVNMAIDQTTAFYESIIAEKDAENLAAIRKLSGEYEESIASALRERDEAKKALEQAEADANDLRNVVRALNDEKARMQEELAAVKQQLAQVTLEKQDAERKRDAAVREIESLKAQIVELEQLAAANKKSKPESLRISLTSTITNDTPILSAKELALQRAGLAHLLKPQNVGGEPSGGTFPNQTEDRIVNIVAGSENNQPDQNGQEVSQEEFRHRGDDLGAGQNVVQETTACPGSHEDHQTISAAVIEERFEERFKEIEARLSRLEKHPNIRIAS